MSIVFSSDYRHLSQKGFSLTEIILASAIIVVAILPVFDMVSNATRAVASVEEETIAFSLATEAMEWISSVSHQDLKWRAAKLNIFPDDSLQEDTDKVEYVEIEVKSYQIEDHKIIYEPAEDFRRYQRKTRIYREDLRTKSIKIEVIVGWKARMDRSKDGQSHEVRLEYLSWPAVPE